MYVQYEELYVQTVTLIINSKQKAAGVSGRRASVPSAPNCLRHWLVVHLQKKLGTACHLCLMGKPLPVDHIQ